jgi:formylmethanofuran dehydrogenase subunit E
VWKTYQEAKDPAWKTYQEASDTAWKTYQEAMQKTLKTFLTCQKCNRQLTKKEAANPEPFCNQCYQKGDIKDTSP